MEEKSGFSLKTYCALFILGLIIMVIDVHLIESGILSIVGFVMILISIMPRDELKESWRNDFILKKD
ncbi:MAG: hypothetical protein ACLFNO_02660 [Parcubacteria group bacterium]